MLTNSDLAIIVNTVMTRSDGTLNSAILAKRKPPKLRCIARASGEPEPAPTAPARISTGKVNFAVMLDQQSEELRKVEHSRGAYDRMIQDFVTKQQQLSERFSTLLS